MKTNQLLSARKELKSTKSNRYRHIFQCQHCGKTKTQQEYERSLKCKCGGLMPIIISYDANNTEYNGQSGEPWEEPKTTTNAKTAMQIIREDLGLTQGDLADKFKVSQQFISQIEKRKRSITEDMGEWIIENL